MGEVKDPAEVALAAGGFEDRPALADAREAGDVQHVRPRTGPQVAANIIDDPGTLGEVHPRDGETSLVPPLPLVEAEDTLERADQGREVLGDEARVVVQDGAQVCQRLDLN